MPGVFVRSVLCLALICGAAYSQTTFASITGSVTDSSGAVVPGATVTVTNTETNIQSVTKSNEAGLYTVAQLKEGSYKLTVAAAGFQQFTAENISLVARDVRRVDAHLQVGGTSTTVEVTGGATLIETETARISNTTTANSLKSLPMNARWLWAYITQAAGVVNGWDGYRFAGSLGNQSNWSIDGGTMNDGAGYWIGPLANYIESFQEIRIDSANNSAEFGAIGQVTIISKSGTNQLHGSAFDYYMTPGLKARPWFSNSVDRSRYHLLGGSAGGPVYIPKLYNGKDRTFFYYDYETSRGSSNTQFLNPTVPTQAWRNGDFSSLGSVIYDPLNGQPFPNNRIPAERINPVSKMFQEKFYPLPNSGDVNTFHTSNYKEAKVRTWNPSTYWVARIDHKISERDSLYGRVTWVDGRNDVWEGNLPTIGQRNQHRMDRAANIAETHTFSPTMVNEFRWGMNLNNNPIMGPINGLDLTKQLGLVGLAPDLPDIAGMLKVYWSGINLTTPTEYNYSNPGYRNHNETFQDYVSWFRGRHSLKFGIDIARIELDEMYADDALFGSVRFSSRFTGSTVDGQAVGGHPYADFLLGIPTTATRAFPPFLNARNRWQYAGFLQDDFKVSPKLTLGLGLRYQQHRPWRDNANRLAIFDVTKGTIIVPNGSLQKVSPLFPKTLAPIAEAGSAGLDGTSIAIADTKNFAPRLGVAYRPFGSNTVIRAGWGMYYDVAPWEMETGGMPYRMSEAPYTNPLNNPDVIFPRVFPAGGTTGTGASLPAAVDPHLKMPYSIQYNLTAEHQIGYTGLRLSYIGTAGRKISYVYDYNAPAADSRPYIEKPRPYMQYGSIMYRTNGGSHQYHGLTAQVKHQRPSGLYFQLSGTWARDIYDMTQWDTLENPHDRQRDRAVSPDIPTFRVVSNMVYMLPFGKGRRLLGNANRLTNAVLGGWEYSLIYAFQTGNFLTPYWSGPDPTGTFYTGSSTPADVTIRPDQIGNPNLPYGDRTIEQWFDPSAFTAPAPGRFGTAAKGVIMGPHTNVWKMGLAKETRLSEKGPTLRMEIQGRNIFNHPNWSNPDTNITSGGVGQITWAGGISDDAYQREFRLGLRLEF